MQADEPEVVVLETLEAAQAAAAERMAANAERAGRERGRCLWALSGGSAPPGVLLRLTNAPLVERVPWPGLSVVWADERYVPYSDSDSNYLMVRHSLLNYVPIPSEQIFPVATYYRDPAQATAIYDRLLQSLLASHVGQIDLALLGMGPDGHTASLFPGHPGLEADPERLALLIEAAPKPPPLRVSLSPTALNRVREVLFLVTGAEKAPKVRAALQGPYDPHATPAQFVRPVAGHVTWILDAAAASALD
jgi:6-phosphogluconolactonase